MNPVPGWFWFYLGAQVVMNCVHEYRLTQLEKQQRRFDREVHEFLDALRVVVAPEKH